MPMTHVNSLADTMMSKGEKSYSSQKITPISKSEMDIMNDAIRVGYLVFPSKEFLWKLFRTQNTHELQLFEKKFKASVSSADLSKRNRLSARSSSQKIELFYDFNLVKYFNLSYSHIAEIGDIYLCQNIQILILSENYLTRIEPLICCVHLIRLDLHKNQVHALPNVEFWSSLKKLKILYLHNNPIAKIANLKRLASSPSLEILTLYDTPISLKKNYRHRVVNIILTLKAFDNQIVSDEEIIEHGKFSDRFSVKNTVFTKNLILPKLANNSYEDELKITYDLLRSVNKVLAHHSPVHILQKFTRGYIDRQYVKLRKNVVNWATVTIQKWWRHHKNKVYMPEKKSLTINLKQQPKHSSFVSSAVSSKTDFKENSDSSKFTLKLRYSKTESMENFIKNETSHLTDFLTKKPTRLKRRSKSADFDKYKKLEQKLRFEKTVRKSQSTTHSARRISPNRLKQDSDLSELFKKLANTAKIAEKDGTSRTSKQSIANFDYNQLDLDRKYIDTRLYVNSNCNDERIKHMRRPHRLPPLVVKASLNPRKHYIHDLANETKFYSENVQLLKVDAHERLIKTRVVETAKRGAIKTIDQRFFQKAYGNMSLGCLKAVDKAYADRSNTERQNLKAVNVRNQRENKEMMRKNIQLYRDERLRDVQKVRDQEKAKLEVQRRRLDLNKIQLAETVQETKKKDKEFNIDRRKDVLVAIDFNKQHLSVSKALEKHEYGLFKDERLKAKLTNVTKWRTQRQRQHDIIKRFLAMRNLKRTAENKRLAEQIKLSVNNREHYRRFIAKNRVHFVNASKSILTDAVNTIRTTLNEAMEANDAVQQPPASQKLLLRNHLPKIAFRSMRSILDQVDNLEYDEGDNCIDDDDDDEPVELTNQNSIQVVQHPNMGNQTFITS